MHAAFLVFACNMHVVVTCTWFHLMHVTECNNLFLAGVASWWVYIHQFGVPQWYIRSIIVHPLLQFSLLCFLCSINLFNTSTLLKELKTIVAFCYFPNTQFFYDVTEKKRLISSYMLHMLGEIINNSAVMTHIRSGWHTVFCVWYHWSSSCWNS